MKFVFVADAACDVSEEDKKKYNINIVPIELNFGDELYPEGLPSEEYYAKLKNTTVMPKTAMPNAFKFQNIYRDYVNQEDVFVFTILISMELSTTKVQAQMAADELGMKNVFIEESQAATVAQGAIIVELAKFAQKENDVEKIKEEFYRLREKCKLFAIINDLKYLRASGRLSGASATIGSMLKVKPIVSIVEGKVVNIAKCMGSLKAEKFIVDKITNMDNEKPLYLIHSNVLDKAKALYENNKDIFPQDQEVKEQEIGYVVGTHVGAGCYGIVFFEK